MDVGVAERAVGGGVGDRVNLVQVGFEKWRFPGS